MIIFKLIMFLVSTTCLAETLQNRIANAKHECFDEGSYWRHLQCNYLPLNRQYHERLNWDFKTTATEVEITNKVYSGALSISNTYDYFYKKILETVSPVCLTCTKDNEQAMLNKLDQAIKSYVKNKELNICQQTCFTKCITNQLLKYDNDIYKNWFKILNYQFVQNPSEIIKSENGICVQFAWLNEHFLNQLGVENQTIVDLDYNSTFAERPIEGHAYSKVKINKNWYTYEAQGSECDFLY